MPGSSNGAQRCDRHKPLSQKLYLCIPGIVTLGVHLPGSLDVGGWPEQTDLAEQPTTTQC